MALYAFSDLHLGDSSSGQMFHDAEQGAAFAAVCEEIARDADAELLLVGDVIDITGAYPPKRGLEQFCKTLEVELAPPPQRTLPEILAAVREHNPVAFQALETLASRARVTLVPGNHDRHLAEPGGRESLDAAGLKGVRIEPIAVRTLLDRVVVFQHGHQWDPSNAASGSPGETMTAVLHHAVIPFLRQIAPRSNVRIDPDRVIALRPEERVVPVLERWLKPGTFEKFVDAFVELLVENGYLSRAIAWLTTPGLIRARLRDDDDLWERAGHTALDALSGAKPLPGKPPPPDVLVLGHTHVIDWAVQEGRPGVQRLYVNLGTWSARASDAAGPVDATMPMLKLEADQKKLRAELSDRSPRMRPLQFFEVTR